VAQQSQQQQAINAALAVASFMAQLRNIQAGVNDFLLRYNDNSYENVWNILPTFTFSQGAQGLWDTTAGTGTITTTNGSTAVTFGSSQTGLSGTYIVVTGDTSNGIYLVGSGATTSWVLTTPFGGASLSGASWGTSNPNGAHPIGLPSGTPLNMAYNNLLTAVGCLTNFQSYMTGVAVGTQANTPQKFADLLNS
jgi:hypothetical protein